VCNFPSRTAEQFMTASVHQHGELEYSAVGDIEPVEFVVQ